MRGAAAAEMLPWRSIVLCLLLLLLLELLLVICEPLGRLLSVSLNPLDVGLESLDGLLDGALGAGVRVAAEEVTNLVELRARRKVAARARDAAQRRRLTELLEKACRRTKQTQMA